MHVIEAIKTWAKDKGITDNDNAMKQLAKMQEEVTELRGAVHEGDPDKVLDELGDVLVTCIVQAECWDLDIIWALEHAYNKISKRTGTTINGVFVKDE